jgi:iron complex transport system permease protein
MTIRGTECNVIWNHRILFSCLAGVLIAALLISLSLGRYPVSPESICRFLAQKMRLFETLNPQEFNTLETLIVHIRLPRIVGALLVGAALSVSGAVLQSIFINPLVSPEMLGILAGSSFGAALAMVVSTSWLVVQISTAGFGMVAVGVAIGLARMYQGDRILLLVLGGIISSSLFSALFLLMKYLADPYNQLPAIIYWLMGGFSLADPKTTAILSLPILLGVILLLLLSPYLNILTMGEEEAKSLGVNVSLLRLTFIIVSAVISSLTVAMCGIIGWIGLVIPHIGRMIAGPDNRVLLPVCLFIGAVFLLTVDNVSRLLFAVEIPIGILTSILGIPVFAGILRHSSKGWGRWS